MSCRPSKWKTLWTCNLAGYGIALLGLSVAVACAWFTPFLEAFPAEQEGHLPKNPANNPALQEALSVPFQGHSPKSNFQHSERFATGFFAAAEVSSVEFFESCALKHGEQVALRAHAAQLSGLDDANAVFAELSLPQATGTLFSFEQNYQRGDLIYLVRVTWNGIAAKGYSIDLMQLTTGELDNGSYETLLTQSGLDQFTALQQIDDLLSWLQQKAHSKIQSVEDEIWPLPQTRSFSFASVPLENIYSDKNQLDDAFIAEYQNNTLSRYSDASFSCALPEAARGELRAHRSEGSKYYNPNL